MSEVVTPRACRLSADLQQLQGRLQAGGAEQQRAAGEAQELLAANDRCMSVWHTPFLHVTCELFMKAAGGVVVHGVCVLGSALPILGSTCASSTH